MKIQENVLDFFEADDAFVSAPEAAFYNRSAIFALLLLGPVHPSAGTEARSDLDYSDSFQQCSRII
jgi:hypothetical protein